jgi:hypothetical protein
VDVKVHQQVRSLDGTLLADREVTHVYAFRDGLVVRMDVIEPREQDRPRARRRHPRA